MNITHPPPEQVEPVAIGAIASVIPGLTTSRYQAHGPGATAYPVISLGDLDLLGGLPSLVDLEPIRLEPGAPVKQARAETGDVLLAARGTQFKVAIVEDQTAGAIIGGNIIAVRLGPVLRPEVLAAWLLSPAGQREVLSRAKSSTRLLSLTLAAVQTLQVPVPPPAVQAKIADLFHATRDAHRAALAAADHRRALGMAALSALLSTAQPEEPR